MAIFSTWLGEPEFLFVVRKISEMDAWSGQVAFPGGRWKPGDRNLLETAGRELWEETRLRLGEDVEVLRILSEVRPRNMPKLAVTPLLARALGRPTPRLGEELSTYFWARVKSLERVEKVVRMPDGSARTVPAFRHGVWIIWGMTARIVEQILPIFGQLL